MQYAPLRCASNFSFLEGASHPDELVARAHEHGLAALALTDRNGVYGVVRAWTKAKELSVRMIVGAEVTIDDGSTLTLLTRDLAGYGNLCELLTAGHRRSDKGECRVAWAEICARAGGLIALWGGEGSLLANGGESFAARAPELVDAFGDRLYASIARHRAPQDERIEARTRERARRFGIELVAANRVLYHDRARRRLQDVQTCTRLGVTLAHAKNALRPNAEYDLKSAQAMAELFADEPALLARTLEVAERCTFSLGDLRYRYPSERLPDGTTSSQYLRQLTFEGARFRFDGEVPNAVREQLERELAVIDHLDYCGHFLTMRDIVEFCRGANILCQGRGSAANSAVCFCLRITAVDPVRMGLLFERFISIERAEPPDIDLDIEHARREEVIQHVYAKYGRAHAAMVANVICYRMRSALRDVAKALGFPESRITRVTQLLSHWDKVDDEHLRSGGVDLASREGRALVELASELDGFPRHLSIHPGGFLLGHTAVSSLVPIENGRMPDRTVIQWDKSDIEELGLFKVDLLGLGALTHLHACFDLLKRHRDLELSIATIPPDDEATFDACCAADTVGVFQIESRAQMAMLPRLRPRNYYDLVIEVSIVRPGPITGGMVHPFLRRRNHEEKVEFPHPSLEPVLAKTLGVPLFQEQVMRLAVIAADYTPGESDQLRRDMAAWSKAGRIEQHRERLISRMRSKGIAQEFAERVFQQIRGFGEYGFPESHAASFALISYAGAWLKCHYPAEFTCGLLIAQPMGFYSIASIVEDARRHGLEVRAIDVNASQWECSLEDASPAASSWTVPASDSTRPPAPSEHAVAPEQRVMSEAGSVHDDKLDARLAIRMGLRFVKGLGQRERNTILSARSTSPFTSLADFESRTAFDAGALDALAEAGAFTCFDLERRAALWDARGLATAVPPTLFDDEQTPRFADLSELEMITWDFERSSHSTRGHPLLPLRAELRALDLPSAADVSAVDDGELVHYAGLVICRQRPATASGVTFMTLEDETGFVNLIIRRNVFEEHEQIVRTEAFLGVTGKSQVQQGVVHILAEEFWRPPLASAPPHVDSHDFH